MSEWSRREKVREGGGRSCHTFEETNQVGFGGFLKSSDGRGLETQVSLVVLGNLSDQTLEGELADQELSALLVPPDLTEGHGTRPEPVGLLDAS